MSTDTDSRPPEAAAGAPGDPPEEPGRTGMGLAMQIFLGAAALLSCSIGLALFLASRRAQGIAETRIAEELRRAPVVYAGYMSSQSGVREGQVRAIADGTGLKALLAESAVDFDTYHDMAMDLAHRLGADKVFLFDPRGALLTRTDRAPREEAGRDFSPLSWVNLPRTRLSESSSVIFDVQGTRSLYLVASAPVTQGAGSERRLNGVVAAAFPLGDAWARELGSLMSADVAVLGNVAPRGAVPSVALLAATPGLRRAGLPGAVPEPRAFAEALFRRGESFGPVEVRLPGRTLIGTALPIRSGDGIPIAALLVARSKDGEMAAFRQIRGSLLIVGAVLLLVSLPLSLVWAMLLSRPIRQLADVAEEIARGQLDVRLPRAGGEVGVLARSFGSMVAELKAKAALEAVVAGDRPQRSVPPPAPPPDLGAGLAAGGAFAGRYELLSVLGEGGMGTVYRARDRELDDEVALKVLKPASSQGDAPTLSLSGPTAELLRQEIKLARMVTHLNVVRVHDFGETEGVRYFTMEYVPGTTLQELLGRQAVLDLVPTLQIAKQVCRGLAAVHRAGIIHGDLKPQNVIVMGTGVVKLMDFGVARTRSALTRGGPLAGTPAYMSPEQARGGELDERSDLYSAGVLLFELFTGRCPFAGSDPYETMRMHLDEPPPDPRKLRPQLPEALARIISTCLDKSRLRRPASASDLERLLMRVRI